MEYIYTVHKLSYSLLSQCGINWTYTRSYKHNILHFTLVSIVTGGYCTDMKLWILFHVPQEVVKCKLPCLQCKLHSMFANNIPVPRPLPSFPSLAVWYCKRREAGRGPGKDQSGWRI